MAISLSSSFNFSFTIIKKIIRKFDIKKPIKFLTFLIDYGRDYWTKFEMQSVSSVFYIISIFENLKKQSKSDGPIEFKIKEDNIFLNKTFLVE